MRIDSHHHLWAISRGDYGWLTPDLGEIHRDFVIADLEPHLSAAGIERTVVVQAAETVAETEFLLRSAEGSERIAGIVGWIDMESPEALATLDRLAAHPALRGIRPMIQSIEDDDWILRNGLDAVFDALVERGLTFDALVLPRHLKQLQRRMERTPGLRCVIDHGAKPELATGRISDWKEDIARVASETPCVCKLSGLLTEAGDQPTLDRIRPAADHLLETFGPQRLMFGSDWPVLNLASDYATWVGMVEALLSGFTQAEADQVWAGTAQTFYRL